MASSVYLLRPCFTQKRGSTLFLYRAEFNYIPLHYFNTTLYSEKERRMLMYQYLRYCTWLGKTRGQVLWRRRNKHGRAEERLKDVVILLAWLKGVCMSSKYDTEVGRSEVHKCLWVNEWASELACGWVSFWLSEWMGFYAAAGNNSSLVLALLLVIKHKKTFWFKYNFLV